ncbi:MAG TPA: hypothetical protein VJ488_02860 [Dehalococcoidia bacterium]|nr:hypothetical protein [Dehalococcoidia bacterium]
MAKAEMKCPFSGKMCRNCSVYIGRHYFLCFKPKYRGYVLNRIKKNGILKKTKNYRIPGIKTKSIDPFANVASKINTHNGG